MIRRFLASVLFVTSPISLASVPAHFHYEGVLGTSMDISVKGVSQEQALPAITSLVKGIAALEQNLSTWLSHSEISQLNQHKILENPSQELIAVLDLCQIWAKRSAQHFSCNMGLVQQKWQQAFKQQQAPDRVAMRYLARDIQQAKFHLDPKRITLGQEISLDIAGVAKGYILDQALTQLRQTLPQANALQINIGGDLVFWQHNKQQANWSINLADPFSPSDNKSLMQLSLSTGAIAASGHKSRGYQIDNRFFSHIFAPEDGWPLDDAPAAIVYAQDSASADAVATAISAQSATQGLDWVNELAGVEALIIAPSGITLASDGWQQLVKMKQAQGSQSPAVLEISYQIPAIEAEKYHRPYLSIWITDSNNKAVRNLILLGETERWAKKNSRWWRRVGRRNPDLLDTLARPTRRPGQYQLSWDGLDDYGQPVTRQQYWLHFEASREAGGHDYQKVKIDLNQDSIQQALGAKGELGQANVNSLPALAQFKP